MRRNRHDQSDQYISTAAARRGLQIHAVVTVAVIALLTVINQLAVPEFLWFIFPTIGMTLGVGAHYLFALWLPARSGHNS